MESTTDAGPQRPGPERQSRLLCACAAGSLLVIAVGYFLWGERPPEASSPVSPQRPAHASGMMMSTPMIWPGIKQPPSVPPDKAGLADKEEIIGVSVAGKHRAYAIRAFQRQIDHVVNDLIKDVPVTVTYCNQTHCHKVFTSDKRGSPLDVSLGGMGRDEMLLKIGSDYYGQKSGKGGGGSRFPYNELPVVLTTWKAWKEAHPDTDVYVGVPDRNPAEDWRR